MSLSLEPKSKIPMTGDKNRKIVFFGCPLDCDEKHEAIEEKRNGYWVGDSNGDPLPEVMKIIRREMSGQGWEEAGSLEVPGWLTAKPSEKDRLRVNTENMVFFIDQNGCDTYSAKVADFVSTRILPDIPCLIAIDHSLTRGAFRSVAEFYGRDNVSLIVMDSHTDAIPMSALSGAVQYDSEINPNSVHDTTDPYLYNRPDSLNASSFLHHMLAEKTVDPKNLYIFGVSDYPEKKLFRIRDTRIQQFVDSYSELKRRGCTIVTRNECITMPQKLKNILKRISTPFVYISVDMDIGARNALEGVRFRNWKGLSESQLYKLVDMVTTVLSSGVQLVGMDIMEIDPRRAGDGSVPGTDSTYQIAAGLIQKICLGRAILSHE